jgi:hypothetical protein
MNRLTFLKIIILTYFLKNEQPKDDLDNSHFSKKVILDFDINLLGDALASISEQTGLTVSSPPYCLLDSDPVAMFCTDVKAKTALSAISSLLSFRKAKCVWQKKSETHYQLYRDASAIKYALTIPEVIREQIYHWVEDALDNIDTPSNAQSIFTKSNPMVKDFNNLKDKYRFLKELSTKEQRHSVIFGEIPRLVIPLSDLSEKAEGYFTSMKNSPEAPEKPTHVSLYGSSGWKDAAWRLLPEFLLGTGDKNGASYVTLTNEREMKPYFYELFLSEWISENDQRSSPREKEKAKMVIPIDRFEISHPPKDETWRNLRFFSLATGIPVILRLPFTREVLRVSPEGRTIKEFLDELVKAGFMYKWHQGVLLVCLQGWFHSDREERKTPYEGVVYLRKARKANKDGYLSQDNVFEMVQKFKWEHMLYLGFPAIAGWYDFLKSIKEDPIRFEQIFSEKGLKVTDTTIAMRNTIIRNADGGAGALRQGMLRLREEEEEELNSAGSLEVGKKIIEKRFILEKQEKAGEVFREIARIPFDKKRPR